MKLGEEMDWNIRRALHENGFLPSDIYHGIRKLKGSKITEIIDGRLWDGADELIPDMEWINPKLWN